MTGLAFGGGAEQRRHFGMALDVGLVCEIQVAAIGLAFAGKRSLQVAFGLGSLELHVWITRVPGKWQSITAWRITSMALWRGETGAPGPGRHGAPDWV
jgi:hypothetical protein